MKEMKSNTLVLIFFYWTLEKTKIFTFNFYFCRKTNAHLGTRTLLNMKGIEYETEVSAKRYKQIQKSS